MRVSLPTAPSQGCARTRAYLLEDLLRVLRVDDLHVGDRDRIRPHGSGGKRQATLSDHRVQYTHPTTHGAGVPLAARVTAGGPDW